MEILNTIQHNPTVKKHGPAVALFLAVVFLMVIVVDLVFDTIKIEQKREADYRAPAVAPKAAKTQYRIEDAIAANLLGNPIKKVAPQPKNVPKTTLQLELQGLLYSSRQDEARAIIKHQNKANLYSIGDKIKGTQVSIKDILETEVLLNRNGATESLPLIKKTESGNREIITFVDSQGDVAQAQSENIIATRSAPSPDSLEYRPPSAKPQPAAPRRIKKPNFSGLDNALKKMGEL
jgi:type II secretion system protein C